MPGRSPPDPGAYEEAKSLASKRVRLAVELVYEKGVDTDSAAAAVAAEEGEASHGGRTEGRHLIGEALRTFRTLYEFVMGQLTE